MLSSKDEVCMHLTNYAINKHSENFVRDDDTGSKRWNFSHIYTYFLKITADIKHLILPDSNIKL